MEGPLELEECVGPPLQPDEPLARVARALGARFAALADEAGGADLRDALAGSGIDSGAGEEAVLFNVTVF